MDQLQHIVQLVLAVSTFGLVISLWIGGVVLWASRRSAREARMRQRLGLEATPRTGERVLHLWHDGQDVTTKVPIRLSHASWLRRMDRKFSQANLPLTFGQAMTLMLGAMGLTAAFIVLMTGNYILAGAVALGLVVILRIIVQMRINKRAATFDAQLIDALELAARSLRAGHPLLGAFQLLSDEMPQPINYVFDEICQRHGMGGDLEQVLRDVAEDSASDDMKLFATSVAIQIRTGGNLADLMERLAAVIRDRMRVQRRSRILTAQTQMSKRVLIGLPCVLFVILTIINPEYMKPFFENTAAQIMLGVGAGMLVVGAWFMNRLSAVSY